MTFRENITAILESNFVGFKDEIIDYVIDLICELHDQSIKMPEDLISRGATRHFIREVRYSDKWAEFRKDYGSNGMLDSIYDYISNTPTIKPSTINLERRKKKE